MLSGLMGATLVQAADFPVVIGSRFQFGFNLGYFRSQIFTESELAAVLENAGLSYDTISYYVAGVFNPFVTIEGASNLYWDSAIDFCNGIRNAIQGAGYPLDVSSVQCNVENQSGQPGQAPAITPVQQPSTGGSNPAVPHNQQGGCGGLSIPDWLACTLGVTPTTAVIIGAVAGIGAFIAITRR
jgi:hypothetical protein